MNLQYIVYSNTEYLDVLDIAVEYTKNIKNKTLFINQTDLDITRFYKFFDKIFFYNDNLPFASRLLTCLQNLNTNYILLTHEIDIILHHNKDILTKFVQLMSVKDIDRIELQINGNNSNDYIKIDKDISPELWSTVNSNELTDNDQYLCEHVQSGTYRYNVNPSIWKLSSLIDLLSCFKHKTYREIECPEVEQYCTKFKIYNLFTKYPLQCGYFKCAPLYKFLHITHWKHFLQLNDTFITKYGQSYTDASADYIDIINKFKLKDGPRPFA